MDDVRQLIERAYPELQILADGNGHGRGRELHVCNGRGCQALIRHQEDLLRWFGARVAQVAEPAAGKGRKQLALWKKMGDADESLARD